MKNSVGILAVFVTSIETHMIHRSPPAATFYSNPKCSAPFWEQTDDLFLQPADGSVAPRQITTGGIETGWLRWSPDGRWIAYSSFPGPLRSTQIFRVPAAGGPAQQVTTDPNHKTQPAFSPDGTRLAFTIWRYDVQFWMLRAEQ